jgi:NAD(P)H-hydrate epimerase
MVGAAVLAAKTALRTGVGLSILATPRSLVAHLPPQELICHPLPETDAGSIGQDAVPLVESAMEKADAVVLGPGISQDKLTVRFVHDIVKKITKPCIIDADALNAIAQKPECWPAEAGHFVLTPHPKELSRLMGMSTEEIQSNRIAAAQKASAKFGCVVVLKGARSIVASPEDEVFINSTGNAGMATAGAGDVLSGVIGGLLAQGLGPLSAAVAGTYIHGAAGDLAAEELGEDGTIAGDIMTFVPSVLTKLRNGEFRSRLETQLFGSRR